MLARLHRYLLRAETALLLTLLTLLIALPIAQIAGRWLQWQGLAWADQASRLCVLWLAMTGAMIATRERRHIRIDLLAMVRNPLLRPWLEKLAQAVAAAVCALIGWHSATLLVTDYRDGTTTFLDLPLWLCESIIPFAFAVMSLRFVAAIFTPAPTETQVPLP